jgi:hypothetical protein
MHKSNVVREKLLAKDSNLGTLLIASAMEKSGHSLKDLQGGDSLYAEEYDETSLMTDEERDTDVSDVDPRNTNGVSESDISFPDGARLDSKSFLLNSPHTSARILLDSRQLLMDDNSLIRDVMRSQQCSEVLKPYRWVIYRNETVFFVA